MRTFAESPALSQEPKAPDRNQSNQATRTGSKTSVQRRQTFDFSPIPRSPGIPGVIQTKLAINRPGDEFEQEADRISDRVMRMPEPQLQTKCACGGSCSSCKGETPDEQPTGLQLKRVNGSVSGLREAPTLVHDVLRSPGQPLDTSTRAFMEPRFGHDFSRVRVHATSAGEQSAKQINAHAYTLGSNIVFGAGQYAPGTTDGRRLLAHELTHVVQQTGDGLWSMDHDSRVQRDALEPSSGDMSDEEVEDNPQFTIQRRAIGSDTGGVTVPGIPLAAGGSPLPDGTREYFESRFGRDFSDVRIHTGSPADDANRGLNSHAFTFGNHIWLGSGQVPGPGPLMAHELTHVVQQTQPSPLATGLPPVRTLGQGLRISRQPVTQPSQAKASPSKPKCTIDKKPGSHSENPADTSRGPSGTYTIIGPPYKGESVQDYAVLTFRAWIPADASPAVVNRVITEVVDLSWEWTSTSPAKGCQGVGHISIDTANRLLRLIGHDREIRGLEKKEYGAGLPKLARPHDGPITSPKDLEPGMTEMPLDPTSQYEGGEGKKATYPAFPATMEGPDLEVPRGIGTYTMNIDYATTNRLLIIAYSMNAIYYTWEIFNVTQILHAGMGAGVLEEARRMKQNTQAQEAASGAGQQKRSNEAEQLYEETAQSLRDLRDPVKAARGGSAVDVMTRAYANELNIVLLPASALVTAGGWLVDWVSTKLFDKYHNEHEVAFPTDPGYYMVRCIAQPAPRGPHDEERRMASVRAKIVEIRAADYLLKNTLNAPDALIAELEARKALTRDPVEIAKLNAQITAIEEQSGAIRYDEKGNVVEEKPAGDLVAYLTRLVSDKENEISKAPSWKKSDLERDLKSLKLRLEQAQAKREGTVGVHHRPRVAFVSKITGETYPMLLELTQLPAEQGAAVRLMDLTTPDREPKDRTGIDLNDAMQNAFHEFAWYSELGRGFLLVRLPPTWPGGTRELPVIETGDAGEAVARRRLADLATALLALSIVVPGVGEVSMVIGAALAAERLIRRAENGTLRLDESAVSDTLAILGAVAQGAQLIGKLRIVRAGDAFVGALRVGDEAALKGAAEAFEAARKAGKVLSVTSTVINAGGLIWGDLVMIQQIVKLQQDEIEGKITHAEARRRTASMFASAVTNHGVMLAGALRPRGASQAAGEENFPTEAVEPESRKTQSEKTIPEKELESRASAGTATPGPSEPAQQPLPKGVRARFKTPDGLHEVYILNDGTIYRCSLTCAQMRTWYSDYLKNPSDTARRTLATELQTELEALETRTRAGEDTKALNDAIGVLDVRMREFIAPDVAHELQLGAEAAGTVKPGQQFLSRDAVSRLLTIFNIDEVRALTGTEGLARHEAETIRRFADAPKEFLLEAKKLGLIDTITAGGETGARAADFLGRATRIREVHGVHYEGGRFDLAELHAAFERGDAVLSHGPLQTPEYLEDIVGSRVELENGRLDVGTSKGRMPRSVMNPRGVPSPSPIAALDFVIIETHGTYKLMLGRHHSGLSGGRSSVFAAGEIRFNDKGIVVELANASGHYLPSPGNLDRAVEFMYDRGLLSRSNPVRLDYIE